MEFKQIQELIKLINKTNLSELKIRDGDFQITLRTKNYTEAVAASQVTTPEIVAIPQPVMASDTVAAPEDKHVSTAEDSAKPAENGTDDGSTLTIKSPMVGTFYRSSSPDKEPFIKVGDVINQGDTICIIEAMKLFNEIEAEHSGKVVKIFIEDSTPVEYDQPLVLIDPNAV